MFMGDQAQLKRLTGAGGVCSGLQKPPSSSSRHRGGSAEPGTVCKVLRGLGTQVGSESVPGQSFPGLVILTLLHTPCIF